MRLGGQPRILTENVLLSQFAVLVNTRYESLNVFGRITTEHKIRLGLGRSQGQSRSQAAGELKSPPPFHCRTTCRSWPVHSLR